MDCAGSYILLRHLERQEDSHSTIHRLIASMLRAMGIFPRTWVFKQTTGILGRALALPIARPTRRSFVAALVSATSHFLITNMHITNLCGRISPSTQSTALPPPFSRMDRLLRSRQVFLHRHKLRSQLRALFRMRLRVSSTQLSIHVIGILMSCPTTSRPSSSLDMALCSA